MVNNTDLEPTKRMTVPPKTAFGKKEKELVGSQIKKSKTLKQAVSTSEHYFQLMLSRKTPNSNPPSSNQMTSTPRLMRSRHTLIFSLIINSDLMVIVFIYLIYS